MIDSMDIEIRGLREVQDKMEQMVKDLHGAPVLNAMRDSTLLLQRDAKMNAPVDRGRLRASITPQVRQRTNVVEGVVGSNVKYACIFGAHTRVTTKSGSTSIGQIAAGELVLTQSGHYLPVVGKYSFPATEKPDLIEIETEWRSDRTHKLTVTADHKILVIRNGVHKWLRAGELTMHDRVPSS